MNSLIENYFSEHLRVMEDLSGQGASSVAEAAALIVETFKRGHKVLIAGNGGSAADAQHFAAELVGRFRTEREALPAVALTTDTSALTAIGNDYGFDKIFSRQVDALAVAGDLFVGISTSGHSANILKAAGVAKEKGCSLLSLTGHQGGRLRDMADISLHVDAQETSFVQEGHILLIHLLCALVDEAFPQ